MKSEVTRKAQPNKNYMSDEAFARFKEAVEDAVAYERSKARDLKVTRIQARELIVSSWSTRRH